MAADAFSVEVLVLPERSMSSLLFLPWQAFGTNVKLCYDLMLSCHILPATIHKLFWQPTPAWSFNVVARCLIQCYNPIWNNFIAHCTWFYTENKDNLLVSSTPTRRTRFRLLTSVTSAAQAQAHGVGSACAVCITFWIIIVNWHWHGREQKVQDKYSDPWSNVGVRVIIMACWTRRCAKFL